MTAARRRREQRTWAAVYACSLALPLVLMLVSPYTADTHVVFAIALGFTAFVGMTLQVVLASRAPVISGPVGLDVLLRVHRYMGAVLVVLVAVHVLVLFIWSPWCRIWLWPIHQPLSARAGAVAFYSMVLIGLTSFWRARFGLGYETWRLLHIVLTALAIAGAYVHILYLSDFSWSGPIRTLATLLLLLATASLVYLRVGRAFSSLATPWVVTEVRGERGDATTLALEAAGHDGVDVHPGQFAWLKFAGRPYAVTEHPFSIASAAGRARRVEFTVRALGDLTSSLRDLPLGTTVLMDGPHGGFHAAAPAEGVVLVVAGIGITPAMSVLRTMAAAGDERPVQLVYCVRSWDDATFLEELADLEHRLPQLDVVRVATRPPAGWDGQRGRIDGAMLDAVLPADRARRNVLVCGPAGFADGVLAWLDALAVPLAHVHAERFTSA